MNTTTTKTSKSAETNAERAARLEAEAKAAREAAEAEARERSRKQHRAMMEAKAAADAKLAAEHAAKLVETTARFSTAADVERREKRTQLIAHLRDLRSKGAHLVNGAAPEGTGPADMLGRRPTAIDAWLDELIAEHEREAQRWEWLAGWERTAQTKVETPAKLFAPRDVSGLDDVLVVLRGHPAVIEIGNHVIRSGSCISAELWKEIGAELEARVAGIEAGIVTRGYSSARAFHGYDQGAWLIQHAAKSFEHAMGQCPIGADGLLDVIDDLSHQGNGAPRLAWRWLQSVADREVQRRLVSIIGRHPTGQFNWRDLTTRDGVAYGDPSDRPDLAAFWAAVTEGKES